MNDGEPFMAPNWNLILLYLEQRDESGEIRETIYFT